MSREDNEDEGQYDLSTLAGRMGYALSETNYSMARASGAAGLNPTYVRDILRGKTKEPGAEKLARVAHVLGVSSRWLSEGRGPRHDPPTDALLLHKAGSGRISHSIVVKARGVKGAASISTSTPKISTSADALPIYASAQGGTTGMTLTFEPIDYVSAPAPLMGVKGAFGMYVVGSSMEPVYRQGDTLLVHPHLPANSGDDVLVVKLDGNGQHDALVKTLVSSDDNRIRVRQYNPEEEFDIPRSDIHGIYSIVGNYRRR